MKFDSYTFIVMEQSGFPGNIGDSAAETGRYMTLSALVHSLPSIDLSPFITDKGVLRHPTSPWREDDTSDDQTSPLLAACSIRQPELANKIIAQIKAARWKTGNGQMIHPSSFAQIKRHQGSWLQGLWDISIVGQALLLKCPYRWSDSKKWFERSSGSSSDYLNFVNFLAYANLKGSFGISCKIATKLIDMGDVLMKVHDYYSIEPNNKMILDLYMKALPLIW